MTTPTLTLEKVIEHHLTSNLGQKLTPQLITGLVIHMSQNIHSSGLIAQPAEKEIKND